MFGPTFIDTLRRNWLSSVFWGIGVGILGFAMTLIIQNGDVLEQYVKMLDAMPTVLINVIGLSSEQALGTPEGFISFGFFTYGAIVLAVYAVMAGSSITLNDEDLGILDVVLSLPLSRARLILESVIAHFLLVFLVEAVAFAFLLVGIGLYSIDVNIGQLVGIAFAMIPVVLAMLAMTVLVGALIRNKAIALGLISTIIAGGYFLNVLGEAAGDSPIGSLRVLSVFNYFRAEVIVIEGVNFANIAILLTITVVCVLGSLFAFERRDIGN